MTRRRIFQLILTFTTCILLYEIMFGFSNTKGNFEKLLQSRNYNTDNNHGTDVHLIGFSSTEGIYFEKITQKSGNFYTNNEHETEVQDSFCNLDADLSVYSAFLDDITGATDIEESTIKVRIIAIDNATTVREGLLCEYLDQAKNYMGTEPAKRLNSKYGDTFGLHFFLCNVWKIYDTLPYYVRLSTNVSQSCLLKIHHHPSKYKYNVAACVQPLHSDFENPVGLLEWIEFNKMMGVTHFTFYNYSIGPVTSQVFASYDPRVVSVMKWNVPSVIGLRVYGQFVAASDCAHRYRGVAKYVVTLDTDEFLIVPPKSDRDFFPYFQKLWKLKEKKEQGKISFILILSNASFRGWLPKNATSGTKSSVSYGSEYADFVQQLSLPWRSDFLPAGQPKFVMRPDRIIESGVHWADELVKDTTYSSIERDEGYYFHYRECSAYYHVPNQVLLNNATCNNSTEMIETDKHAAKTFGRNLVKRIIRKIEETDSLKKLILEYVKNNPSQTRFSLEW